MDRMLVTLGERIAARRKELGLRQEDLANAAGVTTAAVSYWETGNTKNLRLEHLFSIADKLKVQARWLALGQGAKFAAIFFITVLPPLLIDASRQIGCVLCQMRWRDFCHSGIGKILAMFSETCRALASTTSALLRPSNQPCARPLQGRQSYRTRVADSFWHFSLPNWLRNIQTSPKLFGAQ